MSATQFRAAVEAKDHDGMLAALRVNFPKSVSGWLRDVTTLSKLMLKKMF